MRQLQVIKKQKVLLVGTLLSCTLLSSCILMDSFDLADLPDLFKKSHKCSVCNGSGQVIDEKTIDEASQTQWCDVCRTDTVVHQHKQCSACEGTGKSKQK